MRSTVGLAVGAFVLALSFAVVPAATQGQLARFPAQQRPPGDPALIERGEALYGANCRFCHGADLRGGDSGGPNLLRSQLVFNDQQGELIGPIVVGGSQTPGVGMMPPTPLPAADIKALAEYIHSVQASMRRQGNPPAGGEVELNILVGDAAAGEVYYKATCSGCHTLADVSGIGARVADPMDLQNYWIRGAMSGRGVVRSPSVVTVTTASGEQFHGELVRYDDFIVVMKQVDGKRRSFRRNGAVPNVVIDDPRLAHLQLLPDYSDKNIHDVTAYLVTLR
jgi:cytochrome c oxidase cbb3-type subunit 3